jgi:hypothetical protein
MADFIELEIINKATLTVDSEIVRVDTIDTIRRNETGVSGMAGTSIIWFSGAPNPVYVRANYDVLKKALGAVSVK